MHPFTLELFKNADENYKKFSQKLIPDTNLDIIGVRTPLIKKLAKDFVVKDFAEIISFFNQKHTFHEEMLLHGLILSFEKDIGTLLIRLENFLPFIDNWAVCDGTVMALKLLNKNPSITLELVKKCLNSKEPYVIRFGTVCLLSYFLDKNFSPEIFSLILPINSDNYYVNMGLAWFYSVALIKQYDFAVSILRKRLLPKFVHNKSIQKAIESFRIPLEIKNYLKTIKIK